MQWFAAIGSAQVRTKAVQAACPFTARPGPSEHATRLAVLIRGELERP